MPLLSLLPVLPGWQVFATLAQLTPHALHKVIERVCGNDVIGISVKLPQLSGSQSA
jgi:hypothetical protein